MINTLGESLPRPSFATSQINSRGYYIYYFIDITRINMRLKLLKMTTKLNIQKITDHLAFCGSG